MLFLRYLTCAVAAFAVVSYTVHLERNTPIVLKVKTALGLDTTNLEEARSDRGSGGFVETAAAIVDSVQNIPEIGGLFSDGLNRKQLKILPEPVQGWQRENRDFNTFALLDFEDSFYPNRVKRSERLKVAQADALSEGSKDGSEDLSDSRGLSGAVYFRENMRLLITMSDPNRIESVPAKKTPSSHSDNMTDALTWRGETFGVTRDKTTGFAKAGVSIGEERALGFMGNVPTEIMQEYLDIVSATLPGGERPEAPEEEAAPEVLVASNTLVPAPLSGWTGSAGELSFEDVLEFDASFAQDGAKRSFVPEERALIEDAFDQGMRIEGGIYESGDTRLLVTMTELPLGEDGMGGMVMGAGIMESTRSFERGEPGAMIQKDADVMVISRSDALGYADAGLIIGGAYLFQMRGNASDEELETYALALDWEEVRSKAVKLNPDWPGN